MRKIENVEELHTILLDLGKEFHRICVKHDIPYYMLGGTMLGAVRHKGFIPWDDDMDFGVSRKDFKRCMSVLEKELPPKYRVLTMDNSESLLIDIVKISDTRTLTNELYKENVSEKIGVNIDIFPLDSKKRKGGRWKIISLLLSLQNYVFLSATSRPFIKKLVAVCLKTIFFSLSKKTIINFVNRHLVEHEGKYLANIYGAWGAKETVEKEIMGKPILYPFEDVEFYGVENPSAYLASLYGDYMKLPPESKRHLHLTNIYWK